MRCSHLQFKDEDMRHFTNRKVVSNFDLGPAVEAVINIENSESNKLSSKSNTMELNKFGGSALFLKLSHKGITNTFEEKILKHQDNCTLPSPPIDRPNKRRAAIPDSRVNTDITLEILDQRVRSLELKIDNVEQRISDDIQQAKDEVLTKIEQSMIYNIHLLHAVTTQFYEIMIDILSKSSQASSSILYSLGTPLFNYLKVFMEKYAVRNALLHHLLL